MNCVDLFCCAFVQLFACVALLFPLSVNIAPRRYGKIQQTQIDDKQ